MGLPMVGTRHPRKASTSQVAGRKRRPVCDRICGTSGSGRSSFDNQQPFTPQVPSFDNGAYALGTLLSRGTASQGDVHAGCIRAVREELDSPAMGRRAAGRGKDRRGRAVVASKRRDGWNQGQGEVCNVGPVL